MILTYIKLLWMHDKGRVHYWANVNSVADREILSFDVVVDEYIDSFLVVLVEDDHR